MKAKQAPSDVLKILSVLIFALYMAALVKVLLLRSPGTAAGSSLHQVNLIPFRTIFYYIGTALQGGATGLRQAFANIAGNVILFLPFGYFMAIFFSGLRSRLRTALVTACFSAMIEILQFILHVGSSDVDDVLLNTLGGLLGFMLLERILSRKPLTRAGYRKILALSAFLLCSGYIFAATQYSAQMGIGNTSAIMKATGAETSKMLLLTSAYMSRVGIQSKSAVLELRGMIAHGGDAVQDHLAIVPVQLLADDR